MALKYKYVFTCEGAWSDGNDGLLCLDTGKWRVARPVLDKSKCSGCGICALFCPPQCLIETEDYYLPNLEFCKGCGICARECPRNAITMVLEGEFSDDS
jgi:pyruvate ferredoxin oxidoreductase delta subunit